MCFNLYKIHQKMKKKEKDEKKNEDNKKMFKIKELMFFQKF